MADVISGHARLVDSNGNEFNACPTCWFKWCPKANDAKEKCDVCDKMTAERAEEMSKKTLYMDTVVMKRKKWNTPVIVFAPRVGTQAMQDEIDKADEVAH